MKHIERILDILRGWLEAYPSLVVTLLWRVELHYLEQLDIENSNLIMRLRATAYGCLIEKYRSEDPDGIFLFEDELKYTAGTVRKMHSPEKLAELELQRKKEHEERIRMYESDEEFSKTAQIESYDMESYTHIHKYIQDELPGQKSLFDSMFANKKFDKSEERNILDILEILSYDEEKRALFAETTSFYFIEQREHIGYHEDSLKFRSITGYDGKQHLCPFRTVYGLFYRGQSNYFDICLSSIDRNLAPEQLFAQRVKAVALERLISSIPIIKNFTDGLPYTLPNGRSVRKSFNIDYAALAQHYFVKTNLLDLTTDKMIAAFFACTGYNWKEDKYYAYNKNGDGVFYVYRDKNIFSKDSRISCVGLQPLSRPGAQAGYVLAMNKDEDFNTTCSEAISFKHDKIIARQIFEIVNLLGAPFVKDVMSSKAKELVRSFTFNHSDLNETIRLYYQHEDESTVNRWIKKSELNFTNEATTLLDEESEKLDIDAMEIMRQLNTMVYSRTVSLFNLEKHS